MWGKETKRFLSSDIAARYGYTVLEDLGEAQKFEMKDLEYITFVDAGEMYANGNTMRKRAKKFKAEFSMVDGIYMLEHQDEIPVEMRGNNCIILSGTRLRYLRGNQDIALLDWGGSQWVFNFRRCRNGWGGLDRLPRRKQALILSP